MKRINTGKYIDFCSIAFILNIKKTKIKEFTYVWKYSQHKSHGFYNPYLNRKPLFTDTFVNSPDEGKMNLSLFCLSPGNPLKIENGGSDKRDERYTQYSFRASENSSDLYVDPVPPYI